MTAKRPIDLALELWLSREGRNKAGFARALGVESQHVNNWIQRGMPADWHLRVAELLRISVEELVGARKPPSQVGGSLNEPAAPYALDTRHLEVSGRLPVSEVLNAGQGGELHRLAESGEAPLGFVEIHGRTSGLIAFRVRGDGLSPAVDDGEVLILDPLAIPAPGERVLIRLTTGERLCKRLLFERADVFAVSDLATKNQATITRSAVHEIWPIAAVYSAQRWSVE